MTEFKPGDIVMCMLTNGRNKGEHVIDAIIRLNVDEQFPERVVFEAMRLSGIHGEHNYWDPYTAHGTRTGWMRKDTYPHPEADRVWADYAAWMLTRG